MSFPPGLLPSLVKEHLRTEEKYQPLEKKDVISAGIPELVRDETSGLLFDPADWSGLADGIARLAADPALRARLAVAARQRIEQEFAIDRAVAALSALFTAPAEKASSR